jgi:hypothetical protein
VRSVAVIIRTVAMGKHRSVVCIMLSRTLARQRPISHMHVEDSRLNSESCGITKYYATYALIMVRFTYCSAGVCMCVYVYIYICMCVYMYVLLYIRYSVMQQINFRAMWYAYSNYDVCL